MRPDKKDEMKLSNPKLHEQRVDPARFPHDCQARIYYKRTPEDQSVHVRT